MVYVAVIVIVILIIVAVIVSLFMWTSCCFVCKEERAATKKAKFVSSNHKRHSTDDVTEEATPNDTGVDYVFEGVTCEVPNHHPKPANDNHVVHIDEPDNAVAHLTHVTSDNATCNPETEGSVGVSDA